MLLPWKNIKAKLLISGGGGAVNIHVHVPPDKFLLSSSRFQKKFGDNPLPVHFLSPRERLSE